MKIYYDYQILIMQKYGGVSRYFYEIIKRMQKKENVVANIHGIHSTNYYFRNEIKEYSTMKGKKWSFYNMINQYKTRMDINKNIDIFHPTYYDPYFLGTSYGRLVITVHDMIHEIYGQRYKDHLGKTDVIRKKELIYKADKIIAVSKNTKKDILEFYPDVPENKIKVIYHGCNEIVYDTKKTKVALPPKYILYIGQRVTYKNFEKFYKAIILELKKRDIYILCLGGGCFSKKERELIDSHKSHIIQYDCNDNELYEAYKNAICFVYPSLYEGFGIPILEAFINECPVVMSNTSCFPEIGGDAAVYFDPVSEEDMKEKIISVIDDPGKRTDMARKGKRRAREFSWDIAANRTLDCYREAINN